MAYSTINPGQDYDVVVTLGLTVSSGSLWVSAAFGGDGSTPQTLYYRDGTSGSWVSASASRNDPADLPIASTTMQVAYDLGATDGDRRNISFDYNSPISSISISTKALITGNVGDQFFANFVGLYISALTSLDVIDTSGVTGVGTSFLGSYANGASSLTSIDTPMTGNIVIDSSNAANANYFLANFAGDCTSLTSLGVPDTSNMTGSTGNYFMQGYAKGCTSLTSLGAPDTSGFTSVGEYFMSEYVRGCTSLTSLPVPDTSNMTGAARRGFMYQYAMDSTLPQEPIFPPDTSGFTSAEDDFMGECFSWTSGLTSVPVPNTSNMTSVGDSFMSYYVYASPDLVTIEVPDTSNIVAAGTYFMMYYASAGGNPSVATTAYIPDTSSITSAGGNFMAYSLSGLMNLEILKLPKAGYFKENNIDWGIHPSLNGTLQGEVADPADLQDWRDLTISGQTLHTNYIQAPELVYSLETSGAMKYFDGAEWRPIKGFNGSEWKPVKVFNGTDWV